jgi:hypothetical protein
VIQRLINSKNFVAFVVIAGTGMALYFYMPYPEENPCSNPIAIRAPLVFQGVKWSYKVLPSGPAKIERLPEQNPPRLGAQLETITQSERDWAYANRPRSRRRSCRNYPAHRRLSRRRQTQP